MTATYFGCPVVGVLDYTHSAANIVVEIPECAGPERITDVPLRDIDVWPNFTDHSRAGCCAGERDRAPLTPTAVAHPDPVEEAGSGTNFPKERR
nr:MAG TPA_asm: hypothetical protein [Caudoviricetes sp.]